MSAAGEATPTEVAASVSPQAVQKHLASLGDRDAHIALDAERLLLNDKTRGSWPPEEMNSIWGQRQVWITQSFCIIKFY